MAEISWTYSNGTCWFPYWLQSFNYSRANRSKSLLTIVSHYKTYYFSLQLSHSFNAKKMTCKIHIKYFFYYRILLHNTTHIDKTVCDIQFSKDFFLHNIRLIRFSEKRAVFLLKASKLIEMLLLVRIY